MAVDFYLKIDTVEGESEDAAHQGWIDVLSFSWGVSQPAFKMAIGVGAGTGSARAAFKPLTIIKQVDKASPLLFRQSANGRRIPSATLEVVLRLEGDRAGHVLYAYKFEEILVTSVSVSGETSDDTGAATDRPSASATTGGGDDRPLESVTLNYSRMQVTYTGIQPDGTAAPPIRAGWDLKVNKPL